MKLIYRHILFTALILLFSIQTLQAEEYGEHVEKVDISKLDQYYTSHHAKRRTFRTKEAFKRIQIYPHRYRFQNRWDEERYENGEAYYGRHLLRRQYERAYPRPKRGWILAYRYDRAEFFDRNGFHYGYFNRYGYFFEGVFYRYDYSYTFRDRVRGRGIFDHYYYRPAAWQEYGFCR